MGNRGTLTNARAKTGSDQR